MPLNDILTAAGVLPALKSTSKKAVLQDIAARAAAITSLGERAVFDALLQRERLGSTGIGNGIAIPHGKFEDLPHLVGLFARLERPIDFEALDGQPVDLIFVLLAPEGAGADHLKGLARIARVLRNPGLTTQLRNLRDADAIHAVITATEGVRAA
jgi:PTS system nitrogen regulatory IIA component